MTGQHTRYAQTVATRNRQKGTRERWAALIAALLVIAAMAAALAGCSSDTASTGTTQTPSASGTPPEGGGMRPPDGQGGPGQMPGMAGGQPHVGMATAMTEKLNELVAEGTITQEQADAYLEWMDAQPESGSDEFEDWIAAAPDLGDVDLGFGPFGRSGGPGPTDTTDMVQFLADDGTITQEQADAYVAWLDERPEPGTSEYDAWLAEEPDLGDALEGMMPPFGDRPAS